MSAAVAEQKRDEAGVQTLPAETHISAHRILQEYDAEHRGLEALHTDIFDPRRPVALSALEALGALADPRSVPFILRFLANAKDELRCAGVRTLGKIHAPAVPRLLLDMARTAQGDALRREVLEALATAAPGDQEAVGLIRQAARTPMGSAAMRTHAAGLYLRVGGEAALEELLVDGREETLDRIVSAAAEGTVPAERVVAHCAPHFSRLPAHSRAAVTELAARNDFPASAGVVLAAAGDPHAEVRRALYAALGTAEHQVQWLASLVERLSGAVEANPALEDELQLAIMRLAKLPHAAEAVGMTVRGLLLGRIGELHRQLATAGRKVASDQHELGWLITRSKEYIEYYADEDFKANLLRWLKGASSDTADGLLKALKATAVRVEVRHFDGYSAVADLIKNPKRTGIALVTRELALAKTGKATTLWHLVRALRLSTIFLSPAASSDGSLLRAVFTWGRQEKLFRLAEAALGALAKVDPHAAEAACHESLALPLSSKVLAIASLHLLRDLRPEILEPAATRLLASQDDPYVTMNAIDALSGAPPSTSGELAKALLTRLSLSPSREVRDAVAAHLGEKVSVDITESLKEPAVARDEALRAAAFSILEKRVGAGLVGNRDGVIEFLYRILRGDHMPSRRSAAIILLKMGDAYAAEVLRDFLGGDTEEGVVEILLRLRGLLGAESAAPLFPAIAPLIRRDSGKLHAALRELLLGAEPKDPVRRWALELALSLRQETDGAEEDGEAEAAPAGSAAEALGSERASFRFERENMQELVMFFTDIKGYSKKAQALTPMQLSTLIQEYEKLLLSHVEAHGGELVKRMGDGHMFVFHRPLNAVLAGIRLQKALRRFNRYRAEESKVVIRVGIHGGSVVRKDNGDVLGNAVNIASRLETSAQPGSVLVSDFIYEKVKDAVHAREIGQITVKNISGPIRVFEPYEIVLDLAPELDPLRNPQAAAAAPAAAPAPGTASPAARSGPASAAAPGTITIEEAAYIEIARCFSALVNLCRTDPAGAIPVAEINRQVLARWAKVRQRLPGFTGARKG